MKYLKNFLLKISGIFLAFFPMLACAEDVYKWNLTSAFTPKSTDVSVAFLSQIFGGAGGGLAAGGSSVMGEIFGVFNSGLLTITGLVLVYVTLRSITDTAMDGEAMGKKMNHWMAIRVAAGIGLLVPKASGYSLLNSIVIWVTLQGVGFADTVWDHALDYLGQGGVIYRQVTSSTTGDTASGVLDPELAIGDKSKQTDLKEASSDSFGASDIFRSLVCMYTLQEGMRTTQKLAQKDMENDIPLSSKQGRRYYPNTTTEYNKLLNYLKTNIMLSPFYKHEYKDGKAFAEVSFPGGDDLKVPGSISTDHYYYYLGKNELGNAALAYLRSCCTNPGDDNPNQEHDCSKCYQHTENPEGICGKYTVTWVEDSTKGPGAGITQNDYDNYVAAKFAGLQQMIDDLSPAAHEYVTRKTEDQVADKTSRICLDNFSKCFSQEYTDSLANATINAGGEYQAIIEPMRIKCNHKPDATSKDRCILTFDTTHPEQAANRVFITQAKEMGWIGAGRYYFDIAKLTDAAIKWDTTNYKISVLEGLKPPFVAPIPDPAGTEDGGYTRVKKYMQDIAAFSLDDVQNFKNRLRWVIKRVDKSINADNTIGVEPQVLAFIKNINQTLQTSTKALTSPFGSSTDVKADKNMGNMDVVFGKMRDSLNAIYASWQNDLLAGTTSGFPLLRIHNFGVVAMTQVAACLNNIFLKFEDMLMGFYAKEVLMNTIGAAGGGLIGYAQPFGVGGGYAADAGINHLINIINVSLQVFVEIPIMIALPMALSVLIPLFVTGVTLAFYVPLIPFMLFTFGIISWLMFVIEAMAAAPLIALGITHPEGHDLLGKAEQALMLLFNVFLRPVGMVIGLVASLVLSYVALNVLNLSFAQVTAWLGQGDFGGSSSTVFIYFNTVIFVTLLMIYLLIVIALMNQCFSLIHVIPEKIARWIGAHPETGPEAQLAETVKGGMTPFAEAGRGAGEGAGKLAGGVGQIMPTKWSGEAHAGEELKKGKKAASISGNP